MSWYLEYRNEPRLRKLRKRFMQRYASWFDDRENACAEVLHRLLFNRLPSTKVTHRRNLEALVNHGMHWEVIDLQREIRGRAYYPDEIRQRGEQAMKVYEAYCFESKLATAIAEEFSLALGFVRECINRINVKNWCRERQTHESLNEETVDPGQAGQYAVSSLLSTANPIDRVDAIDRRRASILFDWWCNDKQGARAISTAVGAIIMDKLTTLPPPTLSDQDRNILRLTCIEGKTQNETGEVLNLSQSTVGTRKLALISKFRQYLTEIGMLDT